MVTGGGSGMHDLAWIRAQVARRRGRRDHRRHHAARSALGLWGPRARDILQRVSDDDVSNAAFPYMTGASIDVGEVPAFALRISYVGELGWELYAPMEMGARAVGRAVGGRAASDGLIAGRARRVRLAAAGEGLPAVGPGHHTEYDPFEAGLGFAVRMDKDFQGREALEAIRARGSAAEARADGVRRPARGRDGQGADLGRRPRRRLRDQRELRLLDRARHRLRLPAGRARGRGHAGGGRVLRRAVRGDRGASSRCGIPRANACGHEHHRSGRRTSLGRQRRSRDPAVHEDPQVAVLLRVPPPRSGPVQRLQPHVSPAPLRRSRRRVLAPRERRDPLGRRRREADPDQGARRLRLDEHDRASRPAQVRGRPVQVRVHHRPRRGDPERPGVAPRGGGRVLALARRLRREPVRAGDRRGEGHGRHGAGDRRRARPGAGSEREEGVERPLRRRGARRAVLRADEGRARRDAGW